jgi:hypothetical protein
MPKPEAYIEQLFDNVNGGDCVDSAAILQEITVDLLTASKAVLEDLKKNAYQIPPIPAVCELWAQLAEAVAKAEGKTKP